jgi:hypothetical protein
MTTYGKDWLAARAHAGNSAEDVYNATEVYPGERHDLIAELQTALKGCDEPESDRLGSVMMAALRLNSLPVLRATVAVWRDAYRGLLAQMDTPQADVEDEETVTLAPEEIERLTALKRRLTVDPYEQI